MKASDIANYFNHTITREDCVVDGEIRRYCIIDDDGVLEEKHILLLTDLMNCFSALEDDYIKADLGLFLFEYDKDSDKGYYEQALEYIENSEYEGTIQHKIVDAFVHPEKIEDDITGDNSENVRGFLYDFMATFYQLNEDAPNKPETIRLLEAQENMTCAEICEKIISVAATDSIGGKEDIMSLYATIYQQFETQEMVLEGFHELLKQASLYV